MKRGGCLVLVVLVVAGLAVGMRGITLYHDLVHRQILVDQSWSRIEDHWLRQEALGAVLVEQAGGEAAVPAASVNAVRRALERARATEPPPGIAGDRVKLRAFHGRRLALTESLDRLLRTMERVPEITERESFRIVRDGVRKERSALAQEMVRFNDLATSYDAHLAGFPASVLARVCDLCPRALFHPIPRRRFPHGARGSD